MVVRLLAFLWCCLMSLAERTRAFVLAALLISALTTAQSVRADCAGASIAEVRSAFEQGLALERARDAAGALAAYVRAQQYTCEANSIELEAARRAASLALPRARAAEQSGRLDLAFDAYEQGGYFGDADRVLVDSVRRHSDDFALFDRAVQHFAHRALPAFAANNRTRLSVTGDYTLDPRRVEQLGDLPARRASSALAREAKKFNEEYLRAVVDLERLAPRDATNMTAIRNASLAAQQLARRWPADPLADSRDLLATARQWARRDQHPSRARGIDTRVDLRYADRANTLVRSYSAAPRLLDAAIDYYRQSGADTSAIDPEIARVRRVAERLGDQSAAAGNLLAAARYYEVAGDDAKAADAREQMSAFAQARMLPTIEAAQRQAMEMARALGTPEQAEALQRQVADAMKAYAQASSGATPLGREM